VKDKLNIQNLVRENIKALSPYSTARDEAGESFEIYLDANENPFNNGYNRYPDPRQKELKSLISQIKRVPFDNIFLGNGSDEAIDILYRVFCNPGADNVVSIAPTYGMYKVAASINNVEYREVQLNNDFSLNVEDILSKVDTNTKLLFLCSPNNPTGNRFVTKDILTVLESFSGIVVIDEAYIDFAVEGSLVSYIDKYENLVILQTLSKAYGLAGLRIGIAFGNSHIIDYFNKVKYPYNINVESQRIAIDVLTKGVKDEIDEIVVQRAILAQVLETFYIVKKVWKSEANFLLVKFDDPDAIYKTLIEKGVVVRNRSMVTGCEGCLRITVGTPDENSVVMKILKELK
jgi:histidinol-phosphate aminotransferase